MSNLKRYDQDRDCDCGQTCVSGMREYPDGEFVKFDDIKELLNSSHNSAMLEIADIIGTLVSWSAPNLSSAASEALYKRIDAVVALMLKLRNGAQERLNHGSIRF